MNIHPQLRRAARIARIVPLERMVLRELRAPTPANSRMTRFTAARQRDATWRTTPEGRRLRVFRPRTVAGGPGPAVLWIHGGGYLTGSPVMDARPCRAYRDRLGATVAAVEYRRAPAAVFPAALDDCVAAFDWLCADPEVDATRIVVVGVSAGGGLAAALCQALRDRGGPTPAGQVLVYPMLDDRTAEREDLDGINLVWSNATNRRAWAAYLGGASESAHAVPARTEDLAGLPPAWIGVGTGDLFCAEDVAYAGRLRDAGVPCDLHLVPGGFHAFDLLAASAPVSRDFLAEQLAAAERFVSP